MNMGSLDLILTVAALVMGVLLLSGHGDFLMKGGNAAERKKLYDEQKVQKAAGVTMILFGIITGVDMMIDALVSKVIYLVLIVVIFVGMVFYIRKYCKK